MITAIEYTVNTLPCVAATAVAQGRRESTCIVQRLYTVCIGYVLSWCKRRQKNMYMKWQ